MGVRPTSQPCIPTDEAENALNVGSRRRDDFVNLLHSLISSTISVFDSQDDL